MYRRFASLEHSEKYGYAYDSTAFNHKAEVNDHFVMFETGGDGLTAHSPSWGITKDFFADYLASLAVCLKGQPVPDPTDATDNAQYIPDGELIDHVRHAFEERPQRRDLEFAASVVYNEKKRRWYSVRELKISSSENKRHDKRYEEIRSDHDGLAKSIFRILVGEWPNGLRAYSVAAAIYEWTREENDRPWMVTPACFLDWTKNSEEAARMENAYSACRSLCEGHRLLNAGASYIENYRRQLERLKNREAA